MTSNVNKCFVAKQKYIENKIDEGFELEVPKKYKWKNEKKKDPAFVHKLNTSNVGMLHLSLEKLYKNTGIITPKVQGFNKLMTRVIKQAERKVMLDINKIKEENEQYSSEESF